jgi:predicted acyl esterase
MRSLVAALAVLAFALPGTASAFTKTNGLIPMSDGAQIAVTYYVPDGTPPAGGWPAVLLLHGLGETRSDETNALGMSINTIAETQLVPQGYVALTFDARGHGTSEGLVAVDGPREIQDVRDLFNWLATPIRGIDPKRIGAFGYSYGGGAIWRAVAEGVPFAAVGIGAAWTDLYAALAPQDLARSGVILGFWQSIAARAAPEVDPILQDALAGRNLGAVRAFTARRSTRPLLPRIKVPTFMLQGRRDFAFDVDQALAPFARIKGPRRLYLADFGHAPSSLPPGELAHVLPEVRMWFDRFLKGLPNGIDKRRPVELARDPWTGKTASYRSLPARRAIRLAFPGTATIASSGKVARTLRRRRARLETFGAPVARLSLASTTGWPHVVVVLSALTPQGKEIVVSAGGARVKLGGRPKRVTVKLISQVTNVPPRSRLRLTVAGSSTAQSQGNLLYLSSVPRGARLDVGPASLVLPHLVRPVSR